VHEHAQVLGDADGGRLEVVGADEGGGFGGGGLAAGPGGGDDVVVVAEQRGPVPQLGGIGRGPARLVQGAGAHRVPRRAGGEGQLVEPGRGHHRREL
jgi:hypothetical protein